MAASSFITSDSGDNEVMSLRKVVRALLAGLGLYGCDIITDTAAHNSGSPSTGWWIFHALEDTTFTSVTFKSGTSAGSLASKTLAKGDRIYGNIIGIQLASGSGILYRI